MKKRVLLAICGFAALAAAIVCLPVSREINTTAAATEYRLDDPAYAVEHTVTIQGRDARNLLGYGHFEGTFAVSGFESGQPGWMIYTVFSNKKSLRTTYSSNPSGEPCTRDLFCLWANRYWSSFAGLIMEVTDHADQSSSGNFSPDSGRFLVRGPADRDAAVARAAKLFQKDPYWHSLFQPPKS